ncbi:MAG: glycoside hydrolase family 26 protein [Actinomycetes bacterium]
MTAAVLVAVLLVLRPSWAHVGSGREAWAVVIALAVLGILLMLATLTSIAVAVLIGLVAYIMVAAPSPQQAAAFTAAMAWQGHAPPPVPQVTRTPTLGVSTQTLADFGSFATATGTVPEVYDNFQPWSDGRPLDVAMADQVVQRGIRLSITWMPWQPGRHETQPAYSLASIISGKHDAYIDAFARSIAQVPDTVTIRLMHEMNGNWYPWGTGVNGNKPGQFVAAWRHVHDRFTALGVTNVTWMWAPNAVYTGGGGLDVLYPGDAYVDSVGVSNYNWGDARHDGFTTQWASFGELFDSSIALLQKLTTRPIWIAEIGSTSAGGSQAQWLADTLAEVARRPEIAGLVYFDQLDKSAGVDWRIDRNQAALTAWHDGFTARPVVVGRVGAGRQGD